MSASFHFDELEFFTVGAEGPKGQRTFFLQAAAGAEVVTFKLEKQQVAALAEYVDRLLEDVGGDVEDDVDTDSVSGLREPILSEWVIGALGVAYDDVANCIVVVAEELTENDDEVDTATARFVITRAAARAFVDHARTLVEAGRDPCPYCARPLDPGSTWCPCHN